MSASTAIKTWKERYMDSLPMTEPMARDEEVAELRAALEAAEKKLAQQDSGRDAALRQAVGKFIKAKGRFHTEQNYAALFAAYDAAQQDEARPLPKPPSSLAKQIADAQAEYDSWPPEKRASVRLEGSSDLRPKS